MALRSIYGAAKRQFDKSKSRRAGGGVISLSSSHRRHPSRSLYDGGASPRARPFSSALSVASQRWAACIVCAIVLFLTILILLVMGGRFSAPHRGDLYPQNALPGGAEAENVLVHPLNFSGEPRRPLVPSTFIPHAHLLIPHEELVAIGGAPVPAAYARWDTVMPTTSADDDGHHTDAALYHRHTFAEMMDALNAVGLLPSVVTEALVYDGNILSVLGRVATSQPYYEGGTYDSGWQVDTVSEMSFGTPDLDSELKYSLATAKKRWAGSTDEEVEAAYAQHSANPHDGIDLVTNPSQARCSRRRSFIPQGYVGVPIVGAMGKLEHNWEGLDLNHKRDRLHDDRTIGYCVDEDDGGDGMGEAGLRAPPAGTVDGAAADAGRREHGGYPPKLTLGRVCIVAKGGAAVEEDPESMLRDEALGRLSTRRSLANTLSPGDHPSLLKALGGLHKGLALPWRDAYSVVTTSPARRVAMERSLHTATVHLLMRWEDGQRQDTPSLNRRHNKHNVPDVFADTRGSAMSMRQAVGRCMLSLTYAQSSRSFHRTLSFGSFPLTSSEKVMHLFTTLGTAANRGRQRLQPSSVYTAGAMARMLIEHSFVSRQWAPVDGMGLVATQGHVGDVDGGAEGRSARQRLRIHDEVGLVAMATQHDEWRVKLAPTARGYAGLYRAMMAESERRGRSNATTAAMGARGGADTLHGKGREEAHGVSAFDFASAGGEFAEALQRLYPIQLSSNGEDATSKFIAEEGVGTGAFATALAPLPSRFTVTAVPTMANHSSARGAAVIAYALVEPPPPTALSGGVGGSGIAAKDRDRAGVYYDRAEDKREVRQAVEGSGPMPGGRGARTARDTQFGLVHGAVGAATCEAALAAKALLYQLWRLEALLSPPSNDEPPSTGTNIGFAPCDDEACRQMAVANRKLLAAQLGASGVTVPFLLRVVHAERLHYRRAMAMWREERDRRVAEGAAVPPALPPHSNTLCYADASARLEGLMGLGASTSRPSAPSTMMRWFDDTVYSHYAQQYRSLLAPLGILEEPLSPDLDDDGDGAPLPRPTPLPPLPLYNDGVELVDIGGPSDVFAHDVWDSCGVPVRRFTEGPRRAATNRLSQCITDLMGVDGEVSGMRSSILGAKWQGNVTLIVRNQTEADDGPPTTANSNNKDESSASPSSDDAASSSPPLPPQYYTMRCEGIPHDEHTPLHDPYVSLGTLVVGLVSKRIVPDESIVGMPQGGGGGGGEVRRQWKRRDPNDYRKDRADDAAAHADGSSPPPKKGARKGGGEPSAEESRAAHLKTLGSYRAKGERALQRSIMPRVGLYEGMRRYGLHVGGGRRRGGRAPYSVHHYVLGAESSAVAELGRAALLKWPAGGHSTAAPTPITPDASSSPASGEAEPVRATRVDPLSDLCTPLARPTSGRAASSGEDLAEGGPATEQCFMTFPRSHDELQAVCDAGRPPSSSLAADGLSEGTLLLRFASALHRRDAKGAYDHAWREARDRGDDMANYPPLSRKDTCYDAEDYGLSAYGGGEALEGVEGRHDGSSSDVASVRPPMRGLWRHPILTTSLDDAMVGWAHTRVAPSRRKDGRANRYGRTEGLLAAHADALVGLLTTRGGGSPIPSTQTHFGHVPMAVRRSARYRLDGLLSSVPVDYNALYAPPTTAADHPPLGAAGDGGGDIAAYRSVCGRSPLDARAACLAAPAVPMGGRMHPIRAAWDILAGLSERSTVNNCPEIEALCGAESRLHQLSGALGLVPNYAHLLKVQLLEMNIAKALGGSGGGSSLHGGGAPLSPVVDGLHQQLHQEAAASSLLSTLEAVAAKHYIVRITEPPPIAIGGISTRNRMLHRSLLNCGAKGFMYGGASAAASTIPTMVHRPRLIIHNGFDTSKGGNWLRYRGTALHMASCGMLPVGPRDGPGSGADKGDGARTYTILEAMGALGYSPFYDPSTAGGAGGGFDPAAGSTERYIAGLPPLTDGDAAGGDGSMVTVLWLLKGYEHYCAMC